jgi:IclR family transcriptional regulator, KDG regulon repressor
MSAKRVVKAKSRTSGVKVLDKTLDLLEAVGANDKGCSLTELASLLDFPVGTIHRLLHHLIRRGYVEQDSTSKLYFLGLRVLVLRGQAIRAVQLAARARPFLRELTSASNCLSHLAVYRDGQVVYVDRVETLNTAAMFEPAGRRVPAYSVALGKVLLAGLSAQEFEAYLTDTRFVRITPNTLIEPKQLREHLEIVRERGYALDLQEASLGVWCVAAPIRDYTGRVIAAISISMREQPSQKRLDALIPLVTDTAWRISKELGFQTSSGQAILDLAIH